MAPVSSQQAHFAVAGEAPSQDPLIGRTLKGTYRVESLLAKGGMGAVYEARHLRLGRTFAVKVLLDGEANDSERVASFRAEAETIAQLAHPHIVQVLDVDETDDGLPYFVMEHLTGETLAARLRRDGALPVLEALLVTFQIAAALAQVHARGIVHCDLKPGNIFLVRVDNERAFVKMLDFGVSRAFDPPGVPCSAGLVLGTPNYMAPEQARGLSDLDQRVDQFALAAMAYEMLSGRTAFKRDEPGQVMATVLSAEPVPLSEVAPWLPAAFDKVLRRALSKAREERFPSVSRFAWELGNAAMQEGIDPDAGWLPPSARPGRYHGAGKQVESVIPPPDSRGSDPPTRVEGHARSAERSPSTAPAKQLLAEAHRCHAAGRLDEAVGHAERLLELAVYDHDSMALRAVASNMALLDGIFEARVGPIDQYLTSPPMSQRLRSQLSPCAAELVARVEGPVRVRDIVKQSGIPRRDCMRLIAGLLRRGALVPWRNEHV